MGVFLSRFYFRPVDAKNPSCQEKMGVCSGQSLAQGGSVIRVRTDESPGRRIISGRVNCTGISWVDRIEARVRRRGQYWQAAGGYREAISQQVAKLKASLCVSQAGATIRSRMDPFRGLRMKGVDGLVFVNENRSVARYLGICSCSAGKASTSKMKEWRFSPANPPAQSEGTLFDGSHETLTRTKWIQDSRLHGYQGPGRKGGAVSARAM